MKKALVFVVFNFIFLFSYSQDDYIKISKYENVVTLTAPVNNRFNKLGERYNADYYWFINGSTNQSINLGANYIGKRISVERHCECGHRDTFEIVLKCSDFDIHYSHSKKDESCNNKEDGEIILYINNSNIKCAWNDGETSYHRKNLKPGIYYVDITDENGCQTFIKEEIKNYEPPQIYSTVKNVSCNNLEDGEIILKVNDSNLKFDWEDGYHTSERKNLRSGIYSCIISDANNCQNQFADTIIEPKPILDINKLDILTDSTKCALSSDGKAEILLNENDLNYIMNWDNGTSGKKCFNLSAGDHFVTINHFERCSQLKFKICAPLELKANNRILTSYNGYPIKCADSKDGIANLTINGGRPPYSLAILNKSYNDIDANYTLLFDSLGQGKFEALITDNGGCELIDTISISGPLPLNNNFIIPDYNGYPIKCKGGNTSILALVSGGVGSYSYSWVANNANLTEIGNELKYIKVGKYILKVRDSNGCDNSFKLELIEPKSIILKKRTHWKFLFNVSSITISGGVPPYYNTDGRKLKRTKIYISFIKHELKNTINDANNCQKSLNHYIEIKTLEIRKKQNAPKGDPIFPGCECMSLRVRD